MKNYTLLITLFLLSLTSYGQDVTFNWTETNINSDHNLKSMSINEPNAFIAGYGNTLIKSVDNGENWNPVNLFNPSYNLMDISIKNNVGYVVLSRAKIYDAYTDVYSDGVIFKTNDQGSTWTNIDLSGMSTTGNATVNPTDTLCFGKDFQAVESVNDTVAYCSLRWKELGGENHSGIFKTSDGANTWVNISGDLQGDLITSIVSIGESVFLGGKEMLYKTTISADTLIDIFPLLNGDGSDYINDITVVDENEFYVITTADSIYYTYDSGNTFDQFGQIKGGFDIVKINDSTLVTGGTSGKSYVSTDNGQSWDALSISTAVWEIAGVLNDSVYFLTNSAIYKTAVSDLINGIHDNFVISEIGDGNLQKAYINGDNVIIVGSSNTFISTVNSGISWNNIDIPVIEEFEAFKENIDFNTSSNSGDSAYICFNKIKFVDYSDKDDIFWSGGIFFTENNWETFKSVDVAKIGEANESDPALNPNHPDCNGLNPNFIKCINGNIILLYVEWLDYSSGDKVEHSMVFKTEDAGKNWLPFTPDQGNKTLQDIEIYGDTIFVAGYKFLLKSVDGGETFADIYSNLDEGEDDNMFISSIWLENGNKIYLTTTVDSVFSSVDGGNTFSNLNSNTKGSTDFFKFDTNSYIMLGTTVRSWFTNNDGETWLDCSPGSTIFKIGGIYNEKFYALAKGAFFTVDTIDLNLRTYLPIITQDNNLEIRYETDHVNIVSKNNKPIDQCMIYSINGQLIDITQPFSNICKLNNYEYKPGIYIVTVLVDGKKYADKILLK